MYINSGPGAVLELPGGPYAIRPDYVHVIPPWVRLRCHASRPLDHFYCHFDLIGLSMPMVKELFDQPVALKAVGAFRSVNRVLGSAARGQGVIGLCYIKSLIYSRLMELLRAWPAERRQRLERLLSGGLQFASVIHYIENHLAEPLGNEVLAEICHLSVSHFTRSFRKATGQTPAQYLQDRRIAAAAHALSFTDESIEHIAGQTGFANRFYFSRVFTETMGQPPARYRKISRA